MAEERVKKRGGCLKWMAIIIGVLFLFGACAAVFSDGEDTATTDNTTTDPETATTEEATEEVTEEATEETTEEVVEEEDVQEDAEEETVNEEVVEEMEEVAEENTAESTSLNTGTFTVGNDVAPGRYNITTDQGASGNFIVTSESGSLNVNEILGSEYGVSNVTATLSEGDEIEISGLNTVYFEPYETVERTEIGTGQWIVGEDVPEGRYEATINQGSSGNFIVHAGLFPKTNEILDSSEEMGVSSVTFDAEEGDIIEVSGIESVQLTVQ